MVLLLLMVMPLLVAAAATSDADAAAEAAAADASAWVVVPLVRAAEEGARWRRELAHTLRMASLAAEQMDWMTTTGTSQQQLRCCSELLPFATALCFHLRRWPIRWEWGRGLALSSHAAQLPRCKARWATHYRASGQRFTRMRRALHASAKDQSILPQQFTLAWVPWCERQFRTGQRAHAPSAWLWCCRASAWSTSQTALASAVKGGDLARSKALKSSPFTAPLRLSRRHGQQSTP